MYSFASLLYMEAKNNIKSNMEQRTDLVGSDMYVVLGQQYSVDSCAVGVEGVLAEM